MILPPKLVTFEELEKAYSSYITISSDRANIKRAYEFANKKHEGQFRKSGDPYVSHCLGVAEILTHLHTSPATLMAGLLHDTIEDTDTSREEIASNFGEEVAFLVESLTKVTRLSDFHKIDFKAEDHRKIFIAMAQDIRVIVIKLADRMHNMRTMMFQPAEKQKRISQETLEVYVPIAHRLGLNSIMSEMQDLALYYLNREAYEMIENRLSSTQAKLQSSLEMTKEKIASILKANNIEFEISARVKSIYSIYKKMYLKNKKFEDIYDILALRIITKTVTNCYEILGLIHSVFVPVPGRFKDYIAMPKPNMYQSLHTTILVGDNSVFEVQIRTKEMDDTAEAGIAAHWAYKEGTKYDPKKEQRDIEDNLHWFKDFVDLSSQDVGSDAQDYVSILQKDIFQANVYVFTPKGKVIDLPNGSTPIDFAYRIHTHIGDTVCGSKVNGKLVPLSTKLKTGDIVEVETNEKSSPNLAWLDMCVSNFAKSRIKKALLKQNIDITRMAAIEKGKQALKDALKDRKINFAEFEKKVSNDYLPSEKIPSLDDFYYELGQKAISVTNLIDSLTSQNSLEKSIVSQAEKNKINYLAKKDKDKADAVLLANGEKAMVKLASCCNPLPGDEIVGFVTKGRGISVHRKDCSNICNEKNRLIEVIWNPNIADTVKFLADIKITSADRPNLIVDIMNNITHMQASVTDIRAKYKLGDKSTVIIDCTLQVQSLEALTKICQGLRQVKSVISVNRNQH